MYKDRSPRSAVLSPASLRFIPAVQDTTQVISLAENTASMLYGITCLRGGDYFNMMEYINQPDNIGPYALEIPYLDMTFWKEVLRRARARSREITYQRENDPEINRDWHRLNNFEYQHFYSAWVAVAYRFKACTTHSRNFTEAFQRTGGVSRDLEVLYQEDDPLFDFL